MRDTHSVTALWEYYRNGRAYQDSIGLSKRIPTFVRFYEGDQWAKPTESTKNLPRPVINVIKLICRSKKSAILSTPVRLVYQTEEDGVSGEAFNKFADYIQRELRQDDLDALAVEDGVKKGSYFYHYFWDADGVGKDGIRTGALRAEIIDVLNIFFANPCERDEQKQEWILIATRESVRSVRAKCDKDVDAEAIRSDESDSRYGSPEQEGEGLCTVLTRYFRKNGEVYCEKATQTVVVNKPFPIAPDIDAARRELGFDEEEDPPNNSLPDNIESMEALPRSTAYLYPIVAGNYERREGCIYGIGEVEGLIPNQKAINFNLAMMLLNTQEQAWGKYIVLPGALREQSISNDPAQIITDYSGTGNGVRRMNAPALSSQPMQLIDAILTMTRAMSGATEVMTGEAVSASMSGAAIAQLQAQAMIPAEELKKRFWEVKEKQGRVLAQFFKLYYSGKQFCYEAPPLPGQQYGERIVDIFNSSDYSGVSFDVVVEAVGGTKSSAAGDIVTLDMLYARGAITAESYIKCYPKDALSNKNELLEAVRRDSVGMQAQLEIAQAQNEQLQSTLKEQQGTVDGVRSLLNENKELKRLLIELLNEAKAKIYASNAATAQASGDATHFAGVLLKDRLNG